VTSDPYTGASERAQVAVDKGFIDESGPC